MNLDQPGTILLAGGAVVTVDGDGTLCDPGWVLTDGALITGVGVGDPPTAARRTADVEVDTTGAAVMPGMVNGHTHLFQTLLRGLADDKPLLDWLRDCIWPAASEIDAEAAAAATALGLIENLRSGTTAVVDHQYVHADPDIDEAVCRVADSIGIRYELASGWADRNYHPPLTESAETVLERIDPIRRNWHGASDGRITVGLAPLIPWGCSDEAMVSTAAACRSWGGNIHTHCAETAIEVEMSLTERGLRHVPWLDSLGVLGPDVQLAHSVWLEEAEVEMVAERGASVIHCPVSNMYLASGIAPIRSMLDRGVNVALATDGPGSNNRQDMFEACKVAALLQKVNQLDATVLQPEEVLVMACRGGAKLLGRADDLGAIEAGRRADLVVVDLQSPFTAPVNRVSSALVYNATPRDVIHVLVDGRFLVRDRSSTTVDERVVIANARKAAQRVLSATGLGSRLLQ